MYDITQARRIIILGNGGSGKSTLTNHLGKILKLPIFHLDIHFWQPGWREPDAEWWNRKHKEITLNDSWIIDGNFRDKFPDRFERADAVIFLDFSTLSCLRYAIERVFQRYGQVRSDMAEGCPEKFDWEFIKWIWSFNNNNRAKIFEAISRYNMNDRSIILKNRKGVNQFLKSLNQ